MASFSKQGVIAVDEAFSIVAEGDGWVVVNKGAPLIVHPANDRGGEPTLLGGVESLLAYDIANGARLSIINRLDRETSGVVLMATKKSVAREFGRAMERREIKKGYEAIVWGWPEWGEFEVDAPILRKGEVEESRVYVRQMVHEEGRSCQTKMEVLERVLVNGEKMAHLSISPKTGRMHQIRVHCAHVGHSIVGDKIYGRSEEYYLKFIEDGMSDEMLGGLVLARHALHASSMEVEIGCVEFKWVAPLARDMVNLLDLADRSISI